ncbi:hypothetical protein Ae201684P_017636 [Aphanomyces euteiches]|uniref:Reverse transcriptase Ty1/copia-type domain-containing protein n=1 Tax=Aphanomyces euteiches TaxID=100861 RepID=A0A6G0XM06_9STRA|nr:hypothetical protein Ae201684_003177 [Aphanomyces euteiches]KAH9098423.1 hypothetical protein Ae201684P_017636 [Aphanomyces euteiches]
MEVNVEQESTTLKDTTPSVQAKEPVRLPNMPYAYYPPPIPIHDTRGSRKAAAVAAAAASSSGGSDSPRESRWDRSHRPSNKQQSTSPCRTKQAATNTAEAARRTARADTIDMRRSTTYNIPHPRSATALPVRKQNDRGQSPTKTMRTDSDRGVATKVPQQCSAHEDDSANAAYDICYNANDIDEEVPGTFDEAMRSPDATGWLEACKKEIDNLNAMACYELASIPPGHRVLKSKWVFKKKDMPDGTQIFKARVVIKEFAQREGLDYDETYAPVIRSDSLRMILAIITATGMKCRQGDATNAYIHAKNDRELYMTLPDGFEANGKSWRILGALYGLKQSAMLWYRHLKNILENFGFAATSSDSCVFIRQNEGRLQIVTVYVDDVLVCAATDEEINEVFTYLQRHIL